MFGRKNKVERIPEEIVDGRRLGWHRHHAKGNLDWPVTEVLTASTVTAKSWRTSKLPLNQGQLGSCTGNACIRMVAQTPGHPKHDYSERAAVKLYELATQVDDVGGSYPPDDTGSTTVGVLTAAKQEGLVTAYRWAFSFSDALAALSQIGPIITGIDWYSAFDKPNANGELVIGGWIRGGHELCIDTVKPDNAWAGGGYVEGWNSWGADWGPLSGRFRFAWSTWEQLLAAGGEVGVGTDR